MLKSMAEPAGVSRGHSTLEVMNFRGRPEHQVRGETDEFERRTKTAENPGRDLLAGGSGEATGDRGMAEFFSGTKRRVTLRRQR